jgi:hypothetical protein
VDQFHLIRQETVDAVLHDGVSLPAAHFHEYPRSRDDLPNLKNQAFGNLLVAVFVEVFHVLKMGFANVGGKG